MSRRKKCWSQWIASILLTTALLCCVSAYAAEAQGTWTDSMAIAHCLGQVDGNIATNSQEAFLQSYGRGVRVLEADFLISCDGELVVRHDFDAIAASALGQPELMGQVTARQHLQTPILGRYTALSGRDLLELMRNHPDVWVVIDTKETELEQVCRIFELLTAEAKALNDSSVLQRLVVQVYDTQMKEAIERIHPFEHWILTVYRLPGNSDYGALADYCAANGIEAMTVPSTRLTAELVQTVHACGLKIYTHTLNQREAVEMALVTGVDGIYTDLLTDLQIRQILQEKKISLSLELLWQVTVKLFERGGIPALQINAVEN